MLSSTLHSNLIEQKYINNMVLEHDYEIKLLIDKVNKIIWLLFLGGIKWTKLL